MFFNILTSESFLNKHKQANVEVNSDEHFIALDAWTQRFIVLRIIL